MSKKILIVDDDLESLKLIGLMLQRRGYEIIVAHAGQQALAKAESEGPDLVILDVMMPDMDGYQICQKLRSIPKIAYLPVLMFTAKTLMGDKAAGFRAGADDYLTKPIHPSELVSHVEALLERSEQARVQAESLPRTRVVGVMGAKGGVGASTVVVNLAVAAGQRGDAHEPGAERRIAVADLRAGLGSVALQFGRVPRGGWTVLAGHDGDSLDQETVNRELVADVSGLHYLPAPIQFESGQAALSADHVNAVVKGLAATNDRLFLDLGCVLDEATRHAITHCDLVLVVIEPERACLVMAQVLLESLKALDAPPEDLRVLMVRRHDSDAAYTRQQVEEILGHDLVGVIKPSGRDARQALEQGRPIVLSFPDSEIAAQFRELGRKLLA